MAEETASRSVIVRKFGSYDAISIEPYKLPPLEGLIEVKVLYAGLNFADLYLRQGLMHDKKLPFVLGLECVGVITAVGVENTEFEVAQRIICYDYKGGMYREIVRVAPENCYPIPKDNDITNEDAAAIFVNYLTAYFCVLELGNLKENQSVLILSCAGGVGWAATQLSKTLSGVRVYGTASAGKESEAIANGVNKVFTAKLEDLCEEARAECPDGFDLIVTNQAAGKVMDDLQTTLRPLGRLVVIGANNIIQNDKKLSLLSFMKLWMTGVRNISLHSAIMNNHSIAGLHLGTLIEKDARKVRDALKKIFALLKDGKIKPKIDSVHPMEDIVKATKLLAERKNIGKVLIAINKS